MKVKFSLFLALFAFIISIIIGFIIDNTIINLLWKAIVFGILFFALGFGSWHFLEKRVPELFEMFLSGSNEIPGENGLENLNDSGEFVSTEGNHGETAHESQDTVDISSNPKSGSNQLGDHILVRDKMIENEPKLLAEAIRTMMDRDND